MARTLLRENSARTDGRQRADAPALAPPAVVSLSAPKQKRASWVIAGVVMVGLASLFAAWVFAATSERMPVVVAARDIAPGEVLNAGDLRVVDIARTGGLRAVQRSQQDLIVGRAARGPIPAGTVLNTDLFAEKDRVIPAGFVVVGAALEPGAAPSSGLAAGDRVDVLGAIKSTASPPAGATPAASVLASGSVWSVEKVGTGAVSSKLWVSILVPTDAQPAVTQAAADGRLRLSLVGAAG